ncbi:formyltransferase family protein [Alphaproteobacteria bacterium]|nr:formyltransferase family protein [Alphaproteobacteria bacterium]
MSKKTILNTALFCDYPWSLQFIKNIIKFKNFNIILVITSKKKSSTIIEENKKYLNNNNIIVLVTNSKKKILSTLKFHKISIGISIAYSLIFNKSLISFFNNCLFNIHPSYLPFRKGPDPIRHGIIENDKYFGVTLHLIDNKIDSGDIISQFKMLNDKKSNVKKILDILGNKFFNNIINDLINYSLSYKRRIKQRLVKNNTYSYRLSQKELLIDNFDTLVMAVNKNRASLPYKNVLYKYHNKKIMSNKLLSLTKKRNYLKYKLKNKIIYISILNEKK